MKRIVLAITLLFRFTIILATPYEGKAIIVLKAPDEGTKGYYSYYKLTNKDYNDSLKLSLFSYNDNGLEMTETFVKEKIIEKNVKWIVNISEPHLIRLPFLRKSIYINSGDSLNINIENDRIVVTGIGVDAFQLQYSIAIHEMETPKPTTSFALISTLDQYMGWEKYLDEQERYATDLIESYRGKLPASMYEMIKSNTIRVIERQRTESFVMLSGLREKRGNGGLSISQLKAIADASLNNPLAVWLRSQSEFSANFEPWYFYQYARIQVLLKHNFDSRQDDFNTGAKREVLYYNEVKKEYKGLLRDHLLLFILVEQIIKEIGYAHPLTKVLIRDYYSQSEFAENKAWLKDFEKIAAEKYNFKDEDEIIALGFSLQNTDGQEYSHLNLKNKIALLYFWNSNCSACDSVNTVLKKVQHEFLKDSNVVFVNISTDANKQDWIKRLKKGNSSGAKTINLYTDGKGMNHSMLEDYEIKECPDLVLLGVQGEIAKHPVPDPRMDNGKKLIELLKKKQAQVNDGPYVFFDRDSVKISYINVHGVFTEKSVTKKVNTVTANTDQYPKTFTIQLKSSLQVEPTVYDKPEKQLVLSDIEGNFDAFRKLLKSNGVIDNEYNWAFGKGHLVFLGDMFDRGEQVTECLWLMYMLEEKARKAGGYVHFILGNHEIMNLSNDQRYLRDKYKHDANLLNFPYKDLYNENSELGKWLRTKNIMEKIGDILYVHGGVSRELNNLDLTIEQINGLIRPHLAERDKFKKNTKESELMLLFKGTTSPFWYRGYYKDSNQEGIIDSTLHKFGVKQIITGHTIVADTVTMHYRGRVINTDTHHADGKSEALYIDKNNYYRVNAEGVKNELSF